MQWVTKFAVASLGGIAVMLLLLWALNGFEGLGIGAAGTLALVLGIVFTSALGTGLMGLIFYSNRSNVDKDANRAAQSSIDEQQERDPTISGKRENGE